MSGAKLANKSTAIILGVLLAAFAAILLTALPQQAEAKTLKTNGSYSFTSPLASGASEDCAAITPTSKKLVINGMGYYYKGSTFKTLPYSKYTVKLKNSSKYFNQTTKISKKAAFQKLKDMNYIAVHLDVKNGTVKKLWFGV